MSVRFDPPTVGAAGAPAVPREADVVVIGSGPGGATLAHGLARRGASVLVVDRGEHVQLDPARPEHRPSPGIYLKDLLPTPDFQYVGGSSKFFGAALYRLRERDFEATALEAGESPAWPFGYDELEPYYGEAERLYGVRGSSLEDPSEPRRSQPYPHPPIQHEPYVARVVERIRAQGVPVSYIPKALDVGPGGRCVLCPTCDGFYCRLDAKLDAEVAALRPALAGGRAQLLTGTRCERILTTADGRQATGVVLRRGATEHVVRAGTVALAAGIYETPLLLRRSRSEAHPDGIGNAAGNVGRYLAGQRVGLMFPIAGARPIPPLHVKTFAINAFYEPSAEWPYPMGVIQAVGQMPLWRYLPRAVQGPVRFVAERSLTCALMTEAVPTRDSGLVFEGDAVVGKRLPEPGHRSYRRLRAKAIEIFKGAGFAPVLALPRAGQLWATVGTARLGEDPATSVCDPECRVHGVDGLYVVDSCALPTAGAVNTALTVMAMSLRAAATIAREPVPEAAAPAA